jgi:hypothetical protein
MLQGFLESLVGTSIGTTVKTSSWIFQTLEALHFIGLATLIGGIAALDLRILGVAKRLPVAPLHKLLPLVFIGFGINLVTGVLFFLSDPLGYGVNPSFQLKMVFILLAGLNALWFELKLAPHVDEWGSGVDASTHAKIVCGVSLFLWAGIITAGRLLPSFAALL